MRMDLINVKVKPEHIEVVARAIDGEEETAQGFQFMFESLGIDSEGSFPLWASRSANGPKKRCWRNGSANIAPAVSSHSGVRKVTAQPGLMNLMA